MFHHARESSLIDSSFDQQWKQWENDQELCLNASAFAQVVTALYEHRKYELLRTVFDRIEQFLNPPNPNIRAFLAAETIETLQNVASWKDYDRDVFVQFLGPEAKRIWMELDASWTASVRLDLADRSILEGEVLVWQMMQQNRSLFSPTQKFEMCTCLIG